MIEALKDKTFIVTANVWNHFLTAGVIQNNTLSGIPVVVIPSKHMPHNSMMMLVTSKEATELKGKIKERITSSKNEWLKEHGIRK